MRHEDVQELLKRVEQSQKDWKHLLNANEVGMLRLKLSGPGRQGWLQWRNQHSAQIDQLAYSARAKLDCPESERSMFVLGVWQRLDEIHAALLMMGSYESMQLFETEYRVDNVLRAAARIYEAAAHHDQLRRLWPWEDPNPLVGLRIQW